MQIWKLHRFKKEKLKVLLKQAQTSRGCFCIFEFFKIDFFLNTSVLLYIIFFKNNNKISSYDTLLDIKYGLGRVKRERKKGGDDVDG